ncbi:amidohydrolase family protein [Spongiactinospora rosea]|uniref:Amidohydrolase family protein n=1 Tax=Spongiactinospora rosea TaxID=2248750 RepID=A0A366M4G4_9ACTN|nr:amidohydrolase family protein [Spongiactinospora rosea]RBQ21086.1 amidohydrolase family protein [Spongiactinospora rosea]
MAAVALSGLAVFVGRLRADAWSPAPGPAWLLVEQGRFAEIVPGRTRPPHWPDDLPFLDLGRSVVLPGLVDSHVHLTERGDGTSTADLSTAELVDLGVRNAATALRAGVTTVADCGGPPEAVFAIKEATAGLPGCARTLVAGAPITVVRGHCWRFGGEAADASAVRDLTAGFTAAGADFIKVMASGGGTAGAPPWEPGFSEDELRAAVETAGALGRPVKVHCLSADSMRAAVAAGVRVIEHGKFRNAAEDGAGFDAGVAALLAEQGVVVCPTLSVGHHVLAAPPEAAGEARDLWLRRHPHDLGDFAKLAAAGVRMVSGTDAGWRHTPFDALPVELELMATSGMTNAAVLAAATGDAADALGLGGRVGRIAPGHQADFIATDADPVDDITALRRPHAVARDGVLLP